jgi:hypothetical protein
MKKIPNEVANAEELVHTTQHKAFIVADIPDPYRAEIQGIREQLKTLTARLHESLIGGLVRLEINVPNVAFFYN